MMERLWQKIWNFFRSPREPYIASAEPLLRLDREAVRRELKPTEHGEATGAENLPPANATTPDSQEARITRYLQNELDRAHSQITKGIDTLLASIRQITDTPAEARITQLSTAAISQIRSVASQRRTSLDAAQRSAQLLDSEFVRFRLENRRQSLPDLSKSEARAYIVAFTMCLIETATNGSLFAQGNDYGLLGGATMAAVFAVANVGLGMITGHAVRQAFHIARWRRYPMVLATVGLAVLGLALNLGVAQYRDALQRGVPQAEAATMALNNLYSLDLAPNDLLSWLLFVMGYVFFWLACKEVLSMKDTYPGYAARYRALLAAQDDYTDALADTHDTLESLRANYSTQIADAAFDAATYAQHAASLHDNIARLSSSYQRHGEDVREFHYQLLEAYRNANRRSRTAPAPAYFSRWIELEPRTIPVYSIPRPSVDVSALATRAIGQLAAAYDRELQTLSSRSSLVQDTDAQTQTQQP